MKLITDIATIITMVAACVAVYVAYQQLPILVQQLEQANEHKRWENYNELNQRYSEIYSKIPLELSSQPVEKNTNNYSAESIRWGRQYFDLCSEEYWLHQKKLLPEEMWEKRIFLGIVQNLKQHPALINFYQTWREKRAYLHPADFDQQIEQAINDSKISR